LYKRKPKSYFKPPAPITRGGNTSFINREEEKPLRGEVQGQKAAEGEERLARTIEKSISKGLVQYHYFRWTTLKRGTVGYKELDEFVMTIFGPVAISVKGAGVIHQTEAQKNQDKLNELIILTKLRSLGFAVAEIKSVPATKLKTQAEADKVGRSLGIYR
jgi:hypothetical protein